MPLENSRPLRFSRELALIDHAAYLIDERHRVFGYLVGAPRNVAIGSYQDETSFTKRFQVRILDLLDAKWNPACPCRGDQ